MTEPKADPLQLKKRKVNDVLLIAAGLFIMIAAVVAATRGPNPELAKAQIIRGRVCSTNTSTVSGPSASSLPTRSVFSFELDSLRIPMFLFCLNGDCGYLQSGIRDGDSITLYYEMGPHLGVDVKRIEKEGRPVIDATHWKTVDPLAVVLCFALGLGSALAGVARLKRFDPVRFLNRLVDGRERARE